MSARVAVLLVLLSAPPASADDPDFWQTVLTPELPHYRRELRAGLQLLDVADPDEDVDPVRRDALLRGAVVHFERAVAIAPDRVEAHYFLGSVRYALSDDDGAVEAFLRVRALDPDSRFESDIAFKMGVSHTRQRRFAQAIAEYDRTLATAIDDRRPGALSVQSVTLSNRAEVQMGLGRLEESIESYRAAFAADDQNAGSLWGLAVVLDRAGQVGASQETAARANRLDSSLVGIVGEEVFFVPPHERHYYLGIAYEAAAEAARLAGDGRRSAEMAALALAEWESFLLVEGSDGRWSDRARRHLADLQPAGRGRPRRSSLTRPRPGP